MLFDRASRTLTRLPTKANSLAESKLRRIDLGSKEAESRFPGSDLYFGRVVVKSPPDEPRLMQRDDQA